MLELNAQETKRYSIARAIAVDVARRLGDTRANSFELEVSRQLERELGAINAGYTHRGGVLIPTGLGLLKRAGLDTKTDTKGEELVLDEAGSFIELLRPACWVIQFGATLLTGLKGDVGFPRQTAGAVVTWAVENPGANTAESNLTLDQVWLTPKIAQATTSYSRQLLAQSTPAVDGVVANDLAKAHGVAVDQAALNNPAGLLNRPIPTEDFGGAWGYEGAVNMEATLFAANAGADPRGLAYLADPETGAALKIAPQGAGISLPAWYDGKLNGRRAEVTTQLPASSLVLGDWPELLIGEWGVLEIITDPYAKKKQGMIEVTSFHMVDVELRHIESFVKATNAGTTAAREGKNKKERK